MLLFSSIQADAGTDVSHNGDMQYLQVRGRRSVLSRTGRRLGELQGQLVGQPTDAKQSRQNSRAGWCDERDSTVKFQTFVLLIFRSISSGATRAKIQPRQTLTMAIWGLRALHLVGSRE